MFSVWFVADSLVGISLWQRLIGTIPAVCGNLWRRSSFSDPVAGGFSGWDFSAFHPFYLSALPVAVAV
jgi:hypothetical protein